jgi:hypothetical protein
VEAIRAALEREAASEPAAHATVERLIKRL